MMSMEHPWDKAEREGRNVNVLCRGRWIEGRAEKRPMPDGYTRIMITDLDYPELIGATYPFHFSEIKTFS